MESWPARAGSCRPAVTGREHALDVPREMTPRSSSFRPARGERPGGHARLEHHRSALIPEFVKSMMTADRHLDVVGERHADAPPTRGSCLVGVTDEAVAPVLPCPASWVRWVRQEDRQRERHDGDDADDAPAVRLTGGGRPPGSCAASAFPSTRRLRRCLQFLPPGDGDADRFRSATAALRGGERRAWRAPGPRRKAAMRTMSRRRWPPGPPTRR